MKTSLDRVRQFLLVAGVCVLASQLSSQARAETKDEPTEQVKKLIETLKTGSTNDRVAASQKLAELGEEALPAVPWLMAVVGMEKPTKLELFAKRVDPARVAAARAISQIDRSKLEEALMGARKSLCLWAQLWAQLSLNNLKKNK